MVGMDNPLLVLTTTRCLEFFCRENQHFVTGLLNTFLKFNNTRPLYICTGWVKKVALREEEDFAKIANT